MFKIRKLDGAEVGATLDNFLALVDVTGKPIVYTYGFAYRHPTTYRVPKTREEAIELIQSDSFWDAREEQDVIHLNAYSGNDMW